MGAGTLRGWRCRLSVDGLGRELVGWIGQRRLVWRSRGIAMHAHRCGRGAAPAASYTGRLLYARHGAECDAVTGRAVRGNWRGCVEGTGVADVSKECNGSGGRSSKQSGRMMMVDSHMKYGHRALGREGTGAGCVSVGPPARPKTLLLVKLALPCSHDPQHPVFQQTVPLPREPPETTATRHAISPLRQRTRASLRASLHDPLLTRGRLFDANCALPGAVPAIDPSV